LIDCRGDSTALKRSTKIFSKADSVKNADFWFFSSRFTPDSTDIGIVDFLISNANLSNRDRITGFNTRNNSFYTQYVGYYTLDYERIVLVNRFYTYHPDWQSRWIDTFATGECHATVKVNLETFKVFDWKSTEKY